jgi:anionic cell wall polymer biosynthesis LytR-Cps2A-Psr (LCP) family protein
MKEIISVKGVAMIPSLYKTMEENMVTDIPLKELMTLGKLAPQILNNGLDTMVVPAAMP